MKHLLTYLLLCISAAIILSSCGHSMSLTKRHYRNGYHFQQAGKSSASKSAEQLTVQSKKTVHGKTTTEQAKEEVTVPVANSAMVQEVPVTRETYNTEAFTKHSVAVPTYSLPLITASAKNIVLSKSFVKQQVQSIKMKRSSEDGLSLFWLIILILLIIWFFGFFAGGWGLGGLINLLLVIAIFLLILWLLRII